MPHSLFAYIDQISQFYIIDYESLFQPILTNFHVLIENHEY